MDWFLYDNGLRHERVKNFSNIASYKCYFNPFGATGLFLDP